MIRTVGSKRDWRKRRQEVVRGLERVMGRVPRRDRPCALDLAIESEVDCGSFVRRKITYAADPGSRVPAFLLVPKGALSSRSRAPGILALHPTDMEFGCRVVVETLRPQYRAYGRDLAERGFVVLAPAYPLMADYQPDLQALGYESGTLKAIHDNQRGLDLLESLPFVRRAKFGAIGHSLGGHNAIFTAVFDSRIAIVVSSCGFDCFPDYRNGQIEGWTSKRYMPKLLEYRERLESVPFDFPELLGALAPRKVFVSAPRDDTNFKWQSVDVAAEAAMRVFELHKAGANLKVLHPDCGHDFPPEMRERAYAWMESLR